MKADTMTTTTTAAAPVCANCGNTGAIGAGLYLAVDARWNAQQRAWLLQEREDTGGAAWDCLECDQQTPVHGPAALFPYGATLSNNKHLIDAAPTMLALLSEAVARVQDLIDGNPNAAEDLAAWSDDARTAITKATGA